MHKYECQHAMVVVMLVPTKQQSALGSPTHLNVEGGNPFAIKSVY